jgi:hypothetical protein
LAGHDDFEQQMPFRQFPLAHCELAPQLRVLLQSLQAPGAQVPVRHGVAVAQVPALSHFCTAPPLQHEPHKVPAGYWQPGFAPSQLPVQAESAVLHVRGDTGGPTTLVQLPATAFPPTPAHVWHWPLHGPSQQCPSTQ